MDINNIALIIVTAFINLAVSNFIFYRYQKKIEDSFARSMLEYQTKFIRNHEKMVETLEVIYQKFSELRLETNRYIMNKILSSENDVDSVRGDLDDAFKKADDLFDYFVSNKIHLSSESLLEIGEVIITSKMLYSILSMGFIVLDSPNKEMKYLIYAMKAAIKTWDIKINGVDEDNFNVKSVLVEIIEVLNNYSNIIEKHYRAAINTK